MNKIPSNIDELDSQMDELLEDTENERANRLLYLGIRMNHKSITELKRYIRWLIPIAVTILTLSVAF